MVQARGFCRPAAVVSGRNCTRPGVPKKAAGKRVRTLTEVKNRALVEARLAALTGEFSGAQRLAERVGFEPDKTL